MEKDVALNISHPSSNLFIVLQVISIIDRPGHIDK